MPPRPPHTPRLCSAARVLALAPLLAPLPLVGCAAPEASSAALPALPLRPPFAALEPASRGVDLVHLALDLTLDWEAGRVHGAATSWLRALRADTRRVTLAADGLEVREVLDSAGRSLSWSPVPGGLAVELAVPLARGEEEQLRVVYTARPATGLRFVEAPAEPPRFRPEVHVRALPAGLATWAPAPAGPAERATLELRLRVGLDLQVVGSGELVEVVDHGRGERTYVWRLARPVPLELFGLAAGRYEVIADVVDGVPVALHVPEGTGPEAAEAALGDARRALPFFAARLDHPYPFPRHDVVVVHDLGGRGLETATASLVDDTLLGVPGESQADLLETPRRTVVHELAHHWFGALAAPLDGRERWLIEALATWMELEYEAHVEGSEHAELLYEELRSELVERAPAHGTHGAHLPPGVYTKGPWVLRMIGAEAGDDALWRIASSLLERRGGDFLTTEDLRRAALDVAGLELGAFLADWVDGAGLPRVRVGVTPGGDPRAPAVTVERLDVPFPVTVALEFVLADGSRVRRPVRLTDGPWRSSERFVAAVVDVVVDPAGQLCAAFEVTKPAAWWARQASPASSAAARWRALGPLGALAAGPDAAAEEARTALLRVPLEDPAPRVRMRALERLPAADPRAVPVALRVAAADPDPRVRRFAIRALLGFHAGGSWEPDTVERTQLLELQAAEASPAARAALAALLEVVG